MGSQFRNDSITDPTNASTASSENEADSAQYHTVFSALLPSPPSSMQASHVCFETSYRAYISCQSPCSCCCHRKKDFNANLVSSQLLGSLFIGYVGIPLLTPPCNTPLCQRRSAPSLQLRYYFPVWFIARVRWIASLRFGLHYPQLSSAIVRTVPLDADLLHAAGCGDCESIMALFSLRKASPADVDCAHGRSALHVGYKLAFQPSLAKVDH
jgi:hypothetical protein